MKLDPSKFEVDESRSTSHPMQLAMVYPDCPIKEVCMYIIVGHGKPKDGCEYLDLGDDKEGKTATCNQDDYVIEG